MSLNTLLSSAYSPTTTSEIHSSIIYKPLHLHPNPPPPPLPPAPPPKPLTASQKRAQKIHQIPKSVPPTTLHALHALWSDYAADLLRSASPAVAAQLMASAEFVGARIEVIRSACPSLVGIVGVCVVERRGVLYIACERSGRVRGVGKGVCVFRVEVGGGKEEGQGRRVFEVHGRRFLVRAGERGGKKFKGRRMLEL